MSQDPKTDKDSENARHDAMQKWISQGKKNGDRRQKFLVVTHLLLPIIFDAMSSAALISLRDDQWNTEFPAIAKSV